jgi:hypothetical protein
MPRGGTVPPRKPLPRPDGFLRVAVWELRVKPEKNAAEETIEGLCKQIVAEQDLRRLVGLVDKLRQLVETQRNESRSSMLGSAAKSEPAKS